MSNDAGKEQAALVRAEPGKSAVDVLRDGYERLQKKDLEVVRAMNRFADLPVGAEDPRGEKIATLLTSSDEEIKAAGWNSRRELRMALYGRLPRSQWPAAMQAAHERVGMRIRKQGAQAKKTQFGLAIVHIPAQQPVEHGKVITIEAEEKPPF